MKRAAPTSSKQANEATNLTEDSGVVLAGNILTTLGNSPVHKTDPSLAPTKIVKEISSPSNESPDDKGTEEERQAKRQRRLVKNREAAQQFRQRQKQYIQDLEKKIQDLATENTDCRAKVELLSAENKLIRDQLLYLRNFIGQAVQGSIITNTTKN